MYFLSDEVRKKDGKSINPAILFTANSSPL